MLFCAASYTLLRRADVFSRLLLIICFHFHLRAFYTPVFATSRRRDASLLFYADMLLFDACCEVRAVYAIIMPMLR